MRRRTYILALLAWLAVPWCATAQQTLTVADGTTTSTQLPINGYWSDYGYHNEFVYPTSMIEEMTGGTILGMTFYCQSETVEHDMPIEIRMAELTNFTPYASSDQYKIPNDAAVVWSGVVTVSDNEWAIEFEEPYTYEGGNLVINIRNTGSGTVYGSQYFYGENSSINYSSYQTGSSSASSTTIGTPSPFIPKCTFQYTQGEGTICYRPSNLTVSDITANGCTVSWNTRGDATTWMIYVDGEEIEVYDSTYEISTLSSSSTYTVKVRTICGDGDTSGAVSAQFQTLCTPYAEDALPVEEGFESMAASNLSDCWSRYQEKKEGYSTSTATISTTALPNVSTTMAHSGSKSLQMMSLRGEEYDDDYYYEYDDFTAAFMPSFENSLQELTLSFWYRVPSGNQYVKLGVGVSGSPNDTTSFTRLMTIEPADTGWHMYDVDLAAYTGTGSIITFVQTPKGFEDGYYLDYRYGYIDDIKVELTPDCTRPASVSVKELQAESTYITWIDGGETGTYRVVLNNDEDGAYVVTGDTATLVELTPNTDYTVAVSKLCDGAYTEARQYSFHSPCLPVAHDELPWTYNFDELTPGYSSSTYLNIPCMTIHHYASSYAVLPYITAGYHYGDAGNSLYITNEGASNPSGEMLVLPAFEDEISNLMLSFYTYSYNTNYRIEVGLMSNPGVPSTFEPIDTLKHDIGSQWIYHEIHFSSYEGENSFIAFRPLASEATYLYIDEISVSEATDCRRVDGVSVGTTATSASVIINDQLQQGNYRVMLLSGNDTVIENITDTAIAFTGLTPTTTYTLRVYTVCDDATTAPFSVTFTTPCAATDMPWTEDFNAYGTTLSNMTSNCWNTYTGKYDDVVAGTISLTESTSRLHLKDNFGGDGTTNLTLNIYSSNATMWAVSPAINITSERAAITFDLKYSTWSNASSPATFGTTPVYDDRFIVAISSDGGNWEALAMWGFDTLNRDDYLLSSIMPTPQNITFDLSGYNGHEVRFAFYGESMLEGGDNSLCIDNIIVEDATCPAPSTLTVTDVQDNVASLSWEGTGSYEYRYALADNNTDWQTGTTNNTEVTVTGLQSSSAYIFQVRNTCGDDGDSRWIETQFRTSCVPLTHADLPVIEDFNSYASGSGAMFNPCWTRLDLYSSNGDTYPYPSTSYAHGSGNSLTFYAGYSNQPTFAVMQPVDYLSDLYVNFWVYRPNANIRMDVGVMTDPGDQSTFTLVESVEPTVSTWTEVFVDLSNYTGTGKYIAFRAYIPTSWGYYIYIDDVKLDVLGACATEVSVTPNSTTGDSATISWNIGFGATDHTDLIIRNSAGSVIQTINNATSPTTVTGLSPESSYTAEVNVYCDDEISATGSCEFTTRCANGIERELSASTLGREAVTTMRAPYHRWFHYSCVQQVYTKHELSNQAMNIESISFNNVTNSTLTGFSGSIYLGHVSDTVLSTAIPLDDMTLVYTGSLDMEPGWQEFELTTTFAYNGEDHLLLAVVSADLGNNISSNEVFAGHSAWSGAEIDYDSDSSPYDGHGSMTARDQRCDIRFSTCNGDSPVVPTPEECNQPVILSANAEQTKITLAWNGTANTYEVAITSGSWTEPADVTLVAGASYVFDGLTNNTTYTVGVRAVCSESLRSSWATTVVTTLERGGEVVDPTDTVAGISDVESMIVSLYPNPTSTVAVLVTTAPAEVSLVDIDGRTCGRWSTEGGRLSMDVADLSKGTYFVRIATAKGVAVRKLIIK